MAVTLRITPPNLPSAPPEYSGVHQNQMLSVLRLFFNQICNSTNSPHSYGNFYLSTTQTNPVANTARAVQFDGSLLTAQHAHVVAPLSRVYPNEVGIYRVSYTAQAVLSGGATSLITFWVSKNSVPIVGSGFATNISSTTNLTVITRDYILPLLDTDYIELYWSSASTSMILQATPATAIIPLIPAASLSLNYLTQAIPA